MGAQQSLQAPMLQYKNHDRMGIYRYYQSNDEYQIEVEMKLSNQIIYKEWIDNVKNIKLSLIGAQLVYLPTKYNYNITEICGSGGMAKMTFEPWQSFMKQQINNRRKNQHCYSEEEIWFILYSIVKVGMLYQHKHRKMGDMHPKNIVVTPRGFIQMLTIDTLPAQFNNFQKVVEDISADVYLAPEEMDKDMINSGVYTVKQPNLADVFSFGISMLQAITLQNCQYLYIRNPLRISYQKLSAYTAIMRQKYSQMLYQTIISTIDPHPSNRKSFIELYELLRLHEDNIQNLLPFQFNQNNPFAGYKEFKHQNKHKQYASKSKLCSATSVTANQSIHSLHRRQ